MTSSGGSPRKLAIERLSSPTSELDSFQREALARSPSIDIPADAKDAVWAALAAQLMAVAPASPAAPSGSTPPTSGVRLAARAASGKAWLALPAFIGLGVLAFVALRRPPVPALHAAASVSPLALVAPSAEPVPVPEVIGSSPVAASPADPGAPAPSAHRITSTASSSGSDLEREIALLAQARAQLRAGDARGAQATLARIQSQFPDRSLRQERQVLGILAQNAQGNREAARRSALAFVKAHPESPHDAQLQRLIDQP